MAQQNSRLTALDILRGITVAGMLLVNNPGSWGHIFAPLKHAEWIGLTPTDLVFPFFMFCMGVSMYFSLKKFNFVMSGSLFVKIVRRTVLLFAVGWGIHWFSHLMYGLGRGEPFGGLVNNLDTMRYLGVFQRLALCYFFGSLCVVYLNHRLLPWIVGFILVAYAMILAMGHGYDFTLQNIIAQIDNSLLGTNHMYHETAGGVELSFDPEGILSTLPCLAHTLIGFLAGKLITEYNDNKERVVKLSLLGFVLMLVGWLLSYGIPCGKKMWSSTFVLLTTGMAMALLALLIDVIDIKGYKKWSSFFHVFGINPLSLYVVGSLLSIVFGSVPIGTLPDGSNLTAKGAIYDAYCSIVGNFDLASCLYAVTFVTINWALGYILYKKKIIIKI